MDEPETKTCSNCKREIPAVNYTIHTVHCARNIKVCPVCKEPVPLSDLAEHHETMHKLLPCKKCGEQVCGTDLEDHIRDSCAHTIQTCKYCELELPRGDLPQHEGYCGVRTEQCAQCREWVMIKYRQLHLDSNHGFLRLDDDPPPPKKEVPKVTRPAQKPSNIAVASTSQSSSNGPAQNSNGSSDGPSTSNGPRTTINRFKDNDDREKETKNVDEQDEATRLWRQRAFLETARQAILPKRTNDQPQINTNTADKPKNTTKKLINKKRQAPPPPSPEPRRDLPFYSAMQRRQDEEQQRREQTAYNLARGLPPVLSPAAKLERLRKMDKLAHWDTEPGPSRHNAQSNNETEERWNPEELRNLQPMTMQQFERRFNALRLASDSGGSSGASGNASGSSSSNSGANRNNDGVYRNNSATNRNSGGANVSNAGTNRNNAGASLSNAGANVSNAGAIMSNTGAKKNNCGANRNNGGANVSTAGANWNYSGVYRNIGAINKPSGGVNLSNPGANRINGGANKSNGGANMNNGGANRNDFGVNDNDRAAIRNNMANGIGDRQVVGDRFNEIKSSLRELRRGLNEVTAPYNFNQINNEGDRHRPRGLDRPDVREGEGQLVGERGDEEVSGEEEVQLPCEFCGQLQPLQDLVLHQTGCRPDLAQLRTASGGAGAGAGGGRPARVPRLPSPPAHDDDPPVIPCEFCTESLPLYLISEHQERCRRDASPLYLD